MKAKALLLFLALFMIGFSSTQAQGFQAPADGKAVVYFCRVTMYGAPTSFEFFHNDKYIGIFKSKNYMRYELDPGEQLLWASSENKEFVASDLKAGGTYIILVDVIMGAIKAHIGMTPITNSDDRFARVKEMVNDKPPVVTPQKKIDEMNTKLAKFIPEQLEKYNTTWKAEKNFKSITPDMAIAEDLLK